MVGGKQLSIVESRKYERTPVVNPIRYSVTISDKEKLETIHNICISVNISDEGLGIISDYSLKEGYILIFEEEIKINNITAKASIVRWARKIGSDR